MFLYTSSAGRSGMLVFARVKNAIFSLKSHEIKITVITVTSVTSNSVLVFIQHLVDTELKTLPLLLLKAPVKLLSGRNCALPFSSGQ